MKAGDPREKTPGLRTREPVSDEGNRNVPETRNGLHQHNQSMTVSEFRISNSGVMPLDNLAGSPIFIVTERTFDLKRGELVPSNGRQAIRSEAAMARAREAALELFSTQGYGATSMRQISEKAEVSLGNLYHHFGNKEAIYQGLIDEYWVRLVDPKDELQQLFERAKFPDDLEEMARLIERAVEKNAPYILLIFIDVIEFKGEHIRTFYRGMRERFEEAYSSSLEEQKRDGHLGDPDPIVAVMLATRWLFYFFTVEKCFGVPMHFGMSPDEAVTEFIRILRYGVLSRSHAEEVGHG